MTIVKNELQKIMSDLSGHLTDKVWYISTSYPGDSNFGYHTEVDSIFSRPEKPKNLIQKIFLKEQAFSFWECSETHVHVGAQAYTVQAFEIAKRYIHNLKEAIFKDKNFSSCADEFTIKFKSVQRIAFEVLEQVARDLSQTQGSRLKLKSQTHFERDYRGLTIAPFSSIYSLHEKGRGELGRVSIVDYIPGNKPYYPEKTDANLLLVESAYTSINDLLVKSAQTIQQEYEKNGSFPIAKRLEIREGRTNPNRLFFGIESSKPAISIV